MTLIPTAAGVPGATVSQGMFGANTLFQKNTMTPGFESTMKDLGVTSVRWPGGAITEGYFDPANPDKPLDVSRSENPQAFGDTVLTFSQTMEWAQKNNVGVNIVLPTQHLMVNGQINAKGVADIKAFVKEAIATGGTYADAKITAFEIGNEYWGTKLTAEQYGKIADILVQTVDAAYRESKISDRPEIIVQTGSTYSVDFKPGGVHANTSLSWGDKVRLANNDIIDELSPASRALITGAVSHFYYTDRGNNISHNDTDPWTEKLMQSIWEKAGITSNIHMTEWNVNMDFNKPLFAMGGVMIEQFEMMIRMGVQSAFVWPVNQNTNNDLAGPDNNDPGRLSVNGAAFKFLADNVQDMKLQELSFEHDARFETSFYTKDNAAVLILSESQGNTFTSEMSLTALIPQISGRGTLTITQQEIQRDTSMDKFVGNGSGAKIVSIQQTNDPSKILINLSPYEVTLIRVEWSGPMVLKANTNPVFQGSARDEDIYAGRTHQHIIGAGGHDRLFGSAGHDTLDGGNGNDTIQGGNGNDIIRGGNGLDVLQGGSGNDTIYGGNHNDTIYGDIGNDVISAGHGNDVVWGGTGNDRIFGDIGHDTLDGGDGNDTISGGENNDHITGGNGHDLLAGDNGNDQIWGGTGNDTLKGGAGADILRGGDGNDLLYGGPGNDFLYGDNGNDLLFGEEGNNFLWGGTGHDTLNGGAGHDFLAGNAGNDLLIGGTGNDTLIGGGGVNTLRGDAGNDTFLFGHKAHIDAGAGTSYVQGGAGADRFVFNGTSGWTGISDFQKGQDKIVFQDAQVRSMNDIKIVSQGQSGTLIDYHGGRIRLENFNMDDLTASDFIFT